MHCGILYIIVGACHTQERKACTMSWSCWTTSSPLPWNSWVPPQSRWEHLFHTTSFLLLFLDCWLPSYHIKGLTSPHISYYAILTCCHSIYDWLQHTKGDYKTRNIYLWCLWKHLSKWETSFFPYWYFLTSFTYFRLQDIKASHVRTALSFQSRL